MKNRAKAASDGRRRTGSDMVSIRIPERTKTLIDTAARILEKSRTDFVLESARVRAENVVLDQRLFSLDGSATAELIDLLENPPTPVEALRALMSRDAPWE